ncbi:MAG: tRNA pseudouridine(55) synthase TruB [Coxiella sp. RIFCSPHIGHO2_12_FULL_44_14]|nr:MAG: tRNA pseudouridine(55) synthase TruB [Coxiella sp. RIFCSPHIGHO2_12_FULL_44_14]
MNSSSSSITGLLLLDKPSGISSHAALQKAKKLCGAKKAGHTGSLDPLASGMLPICFGEATKFAHYLLMENKRYWVQARLGIKTASGDSEGEVLLRRTVPTLTATVLQRALQTFCGDILQVPPMYSAIKYQGQPLYRWARQGMTVLRKSRLVHVYEFNLLEQQEDVLTFDVHCSKGTYVRTLIDDLGDMLGCGAHVIRLRRLSVGHYLASSMVTLETLEKHRQEENVVIGQRWLLPMDSLFMHWPKITLDEIAARSLRQGRSVKISHALSVGHVQLQEGPGTFLGVGEVLSDGSIVSRRLVRQG